MGRAKKFLRDIPFLLDQFAIAWQMFYDKYIYSDFPEYETRTHNLEVTTRKKHGTDA